MNSVFRLRKWSIRSSLRTKVTIGVVMPLVFILGVFTAIEYARFRENMMSELSLLASLTGSVVEKDLRHEMLATDLVGLQQVLNAVSENNEFQVMYLLDTNGKVIFASQEKMVEAQLDQSLPECQSCHQHPPENRPSSVVVRKADGEQVFRSMQPIENGPECSECHNRDRRLLGMLLTDISIIPFEAALESSLRENLLWWFVTITVTILVVNLAISRLVLDRLQILVAAIAGVGRGQSPPPLSEGHPDEIGKLAGAFNLMAQQIKTRNAENHDLSDRLRRQSAQRGELLKRLITAQEDERKRVARELHDDLGQTLGGLSLHVEAMEQLIVSDISRARDQLNDLKSLMNESSDRMNDLMLALRPAVLDDLGLVPALRAHTERVLEKTKTGFELDASGLQRRLPPEIETTLFRTFQEALNNVVRHAGASHVSICLNSIR